MEEASWTDDFTPPLTKEYMMFGRFALCTLLPLALVLIAGPVPYSNAQRISRDPVTGQSLVTVDTIDARDVFRDDEVDYGDIRGHSGIDCSTNRGYNDPYIADANHAVGGPTGQMQNCNSCHRNVHPRTGQGDRPAFRYASLRLQNRTDEPVRYEMKLGQEGTWKEFEIGPHTINVYYGPYRNANQRATTKVWFRHGGETRELEPLATPNRNLGSLYFFSDHAGSKTRLYKPDPHRSNIARR